MSAQSNTQPSLQDFKKFVNAHPLLVQEVRTNNKTWQEFYEEWLILGADHQQWSKYVRRVEPGEQKSGQFDEEEKSSEQNKNVTGALLGFLSKYNMNDIQQHLTQFSGVLQNVQNIIQNFQGQPNEKREQLENRDPFSFRRH